jgi:hypothetical protein
MPDESPFDIELTRVFDAPRELVKTPALDGNTLNPTVRMTADRRASTTHHCSAETPLPLMARGCC